MFKNDYSKKNNLSVKIRMHSNKTKTKEKYYV